MFALVSPCFNVLVFVLWEKLNCHPVLLSLLCKFQQLKAVLVSRLLKMFVNFVVLVTLVT